MLSDILRLSNHDLDRLLDALVRRAIGPDAGVDQIRRAGLEAEAPRIRLWLSEAMVQFGSVERISSMVRLLREQRYRLAKAHPAPELIVTGPEADGIATRDTRVVVRELFESARRSVLIVGYTFHGSGPIFEPLAGRMAGNSELSVRIVVNVHPQRGRATAKVVDEFTAEFFRSSWPFHPRPEVYYAPDPLENAVSGLASVHAKLIVIDRRWVYLGSANFTHSAFRRNLEVGLRVWDRGLAEELVCYFDQLIQGDHLRPLVSRSD
jgi:phosphatidylserine/phosphatidylglycerophosphate/cardiolipin synthase-like enzyme